MVDRFNVAVYLVDSLFPSYSFREDEEGGYKTGMEREGCDFPHDLYIMWDRYFLHHHLWKVALPKFSQGLEYIRAGNPSGGG